MMVENQHQIASSIPFQRLQCQQTNINNSNLSPPPRSQRQLRHLQRKRRTLKILGIFHLLNSMIISSIGIFTLIELPLSKILNNNGLPIFSSLCFMITGMLALMQNRQSMCSIISHNAFAVLSMIFSVALVAISIFGAMQYNGKRKFHKQVYEFGFQVYVSLLAFGLLQILFSFLSIIYGCGVYDCCMFGCNDCWNDSKQCQQQNLSGLNHLTSDRPVERFTPEPEPTNSPRIQTSNPPNLEQIQDSNSSPDTIAQNSQMVTPATSANVETNHIPITSAVVQNLSNIPIPQPIFINDTCQSPSSDTQHFLVHQLSLNPSSTATQQLIPNGGIVTNPFQGSPMPTTFQNPVMISRVPHQTNQTASIMPQLPVSAQFVLVPVSTSNSGMISGSPFGPQQLVQYPSPHL